MSTTNIKKIRKLCRSFVNDNGMDRINAHGTLLYLSMSGSILHGTNTIESDYDMKGIYLPYKNDLLNGIHKKVINFKGLTEDNVNVDFEVWSLQYIKQLLKKGDSNIIDLLFSQTYPDAILYSNPYYMNIFTVKYIQKYILYNNMAGIVGYCLAQAEKYNVKINTLKYLTEILEHAETFTCTEHTKLKVIWNDDLPVTAHVVLMEKDGNDFYKVFGKLYQSTIKLDAFKCNIAKRIKDYSDRSKTAFENEGFDWKSLSHAYRAGLEYHQILTQGLISFPLKDKEKLLAIKTGIADFEESKKEIQVIIDLITDLDNGTCFNRNEPDNTMLSQTTTMFYLADHKFPTCKSENKLELI